MLQIKNTLGGGKPEGLYAWKKYEEIGTYRYSLKSSIVTCVVGNSNNKFTITLDSSNYDGDLSYLDVKNLCKWLDGSLGIVRNSKRQICSWNGGDYLTFADHDDSSATRYVYPSINNNIVTVTLYAFEDKSYTWNGLTKNTSFSSSIENAFEYYDYDYEYEGYIVSDKETAYPDGGEKNGYWYERVGGVKVTTGTVTPSSPDWLRVEHGLGITPDIITVMTESSNTSILGYALHDIKQSDHALIGNIGGASKAVTMYRDSASYDKSSRYGCCNETFFSFPFYQYNASWDTSSVYRWVCISLKE